MLQETITNMEALLNTIYLDCWKSIFACSMNRTTAAFTLITGSVCLYKMRINIYIYTQETADVQHCRRRALQRQKKEN